MGRHLQGEEYRDRTTGKSVRRRPGVVSRAGMAMVRELADRTGLSSQVTAALVDTTTTAPAFV